MKPEHFAWNFRFHPNFLLLLSPPLFLSWPAQQIPRQLPPHAKALPDTITQTSIWLNRRPTIADNMMPVMQHPAQDKETQQKLAELEKKTGKKPNVVVFLLDDVGWMDVGFNGGGVAVGNPTPDIDAVASQGLILTSAYSQPSSSPTRATILTGQYSIHHGILMPPMYGQPGGLQGLTTLPQLLHDQGYVTQAIGKWHMGENKESQPQNVGFDDFRGFNSVSDMYTEWRDVHVNPEVALSPDRSEYIQTTAVQQR